MIARRLLLLSLVAICGLCILQARAIDYGTVEPMSAELAESQQRLADLEPRCPPQDGYRWSYDEQASHASRVTWIQIMTPARFAFECMAPNEYPNVVIDGCAWVHPDPLYGGYYGVIYAMGPWYAYPVSFREHEECHLLGWKHEKVMRQVR